MKLLRTPDDMPPSVPLEAYQGEATDGAPITAYSGIESTPDFLRRAIPPRYIVDGVIQANRLYSLCGFTGHAKTSLALKLAFCVARGVVFGDKETEQGSVLFLAGENADNVITQYQALLIAKGVKPESVPVFWHYGNFRLKDSMAALKADAENIPDLRLIIVDTLQAFFPGDNDNDNMQMLEAARQFRPLNSLPGNPTVIVLCHPSGKRPDKSNLVPRGGGAFLNEVDGNFSVWRDADGAITLHTQGKHRGAWFDPMVFKIEERSFDEIADAKGRPIPQAVVRVLLVSEQVEAKKSRESLESHILRAIERNANISVRALAHDLNIGKTGAANLVSEMVEQRLVKRSAGKLFLTEKGSKMLSDAGL